MSCLGDSTSPVSSCPVLGSEFVDPNFGLDPSSSPETPLSEIFFRGEDTTQIRVEPEFEIFQDCDSYLTLSTRVCLSVLPVSKRKTVNETEGDSINEVVIDCVRLLYINFLYISETTGLIKKNVIKVIFNIFEKKRRRAGVPYTIHG